MTDINSDRPLSELTERDGVDNVVVFVSDALRFDFLPADIEKRGLTAKAIAPSTFTASSIPSLTSGQYPQTHGVWMFDDQLRERPELLTADGADVGFDAERVWVDLDSAHKPPLQINRVETETKLEELEPPFVHFIHDVGPHAPYGFDNGVFDSTKQFFREYERRRPQLIELYRRDAQTSARRFLDVYDQLAERDILDDTLVVFTSDHGQCLGEWSNGGRFGHGHPMSPENVEIPIVFLGAGLPEGETYTPLLSGTDIAPTLLSAQRGGPPEDTDGVDLWRSVPDSSRKVRSDVWQHLDVEFKGISKELSVYAATSAWNESGGHVFHRKSTAQRVGALAYDNVRRGYSPAWIHNLSLGKLANFLTLSLSNTVSYGVPDFTEQEAAAVTPSELTEAGYNSERTLSDDQQSQLRDLGYLQ